MTGTVEVGGLLSTTDATWSGTQPLSFSYGWRRCDITGSDCVSIDGATSPTYAPSAADVGSTLRARVVATNAAGSASQSSAATPAVAATPATPVTPQPLRSPVVSGGPVEGEVLATTNGIWMGTLPIAYTYQWRRCDATGSNCVVIDGATTSTYTPAAIDIGSTLRARVIATNSVGYTYRSSAPTAVIAASSADTTPPSIPSGVLVTGVTVTSVSLSWEASTDDVGVAGYGLYLNGSQLDSTPSTSYTFSGLTCGTSYTVGVDAVDAAGNRSAAATLVVAPAACPDTTAPTSPSNLSIMGATGSTVTLSWDASSDDVGVASYDVYVNGAEVDSTASTSYTFSGLTCGTSYTVGVDAVDAAGNRSAAASVIAATSACADTTAPTAPAALAVGDASSSTVALSWNASTDDVGVAAYGVYVNGSLVDSTSATSYMFAGLSCGTTYTLGVDAVDAAGNRSAVSEAPAATVACADTTAPSVPSGLVVSGATDSSAVLSWNASTDDVGVAGYGVYVNGSLVDSISSTSYTLSGLSCGTSYTVGVDAFDAAGNRSTVASASAATAACPVATAYQHVVWIVMENHSYDQIIGNTASAPYINGLAQKYGTATQMYAIAHPSLPNYIAMTSGSTQGITDDGGPASHPLSAASIFSQLGVGGWRALEQSMPTNCSLTDSGNYLARHNPATYYVDVAAQCAVQDVPLGATPDLSAKLTFITPDVCHDMHSNSCSGSSNPILQGDQWLQSFVPQLLSSPEYQSGNTVVFITWDEDSSCSGCTNHIPTIVISPTTAGIGSSTRFSLYSLLRTTEEILNLPLLGGATGASSMRADFHL